MDKEIPLNISQDLLDNLNIKQQDVLDIIDRIVGRISYKFTFGSYEYEDIKQEARILALQGLHSYKMEAGELENFLWVHVHNRLCNFKRKHFVRLDKPCLTCPLKAYVKRGDLCKIYDDKMECELYAKWANRNEAKKNIINPVSMNVVVDTDETNMCRADCPIDNLHTKDIISLLDSEIGPDVRPIWLQLKGGLKIHGEDMALLKDRIAQILEDNGVEESW